MHPGSAPRELAGSSAKGSGKLIAVAAIALLTAGCAWVAYGLAGTPFLAVALVALTAAAVGFRRARMVLVGAALGLVLSPLPAGAVGGLHSYLDGAPYLRTVGMPLPGVQRSPQGLPWVTNGCVITGGEWLYDMPWNVSVRAAVATFGSPPP